MTITRTTISEISRDSNFEDRHVETIEKMKEVTVLANIIIITYCISDGHVATWLIEEFQSYFRTLINYGNGSKKF